MPPASQLPAHSAAAGQIENCERLGSHSQRARQRRGHDGQAGNELADDQGRHAASRKAQFVLAHAAVRRDRDLAQQRQHPAPEIAAGVEPDEVGQREARVARKSALTAKTPSSAAAAPASSSTGTAGKRRAQLLDEHDDENGHQAVLREQGRRRFPRMHSTTDVKVDSSTVPAVLGSRTIRQSARNGRGFVNDRGAATEAATMAGPRTFFLQRRTIPRWPRQHQLCRPIFFRTAAAPGRG